MNLDASHASHAASDETSGAFAVEVGAGLRSSARLARYADAGEIRRGVRELAVALEGLSR